MALDKQNSLLLERASRALGNNSPEQAVRRIRAIIGTESIPISEGEAGKALEALRNGEEPTAEQITALEIVIRLMRPVVFTRAGVLDDLPDSSNRELQPEALRQAWNDFRQKVRPYIGSIGRVEDSRNRHVGTGFVIYNGLIATNRHVLAALTMGSERLPLNSARIVFKQEVDEPNSESDIIQITGVAKAHPTQDIAFLTASTGDRIPLSLSAGFPAVGDGVVTIGYPGKDERNNPLFLTSVFGSTNFGMRRASVGEIRDGSLSPTIFHDCSTTQGNSGSPVFLLTTGEVAGIHRSGYFMYRNEAVAASELRALA